MVSGTHSHTSILHNKVHMASSATPATDAIFTSITTTLATERNAGAAWRAVAEKAHLAAAATYTHSILTLSHNKHGTQHHYCHDRLVRRAH